MRQARALLTGGFICLFLLMSTASASAVVLSFTDASRGNSIVYSLTAIAGSPNSADFTITSTGATTGPTDWWIEAVWIKFDGATKPDITNESFVTWGTEPRAITDSLANATVSPDGFAGFFFTGCTASTLGAAGPCPTNATKSSGLLVNGNHSYEVTFNFDGSLNSSLMPFQALYADGSTGGINPKPIFNMISPDLTTPVPEPTSMLLLGSGLVGLGTVFRKRFFNFKN